MIKSENGTLALQGTGVDMIGDMSTIFSTLLKHDPELLIGTVLAWTDTVEQVARGENINHIKLSLIIDSSNKFIKLAKEMGKL